MPPSRSPSRAQEATQLMDMLLGQCTLATPKTCALAALMPDLDRALLSASARSLGLSELAVPRVLIRVAEIPLLGTGKTDYVRLKSIAEAESGQSESTMEAVS